MFGKKIYRSDMISCVLCYDAPCSKACGKIDPAGRSKKSSDKVI